MGWVYTSNKPNLATELSYLTGSSGMADERLDLLKRFQGAGQDFLDDLVTWARGNESCIGGNRDCVTGWI